MRPEPRLTPRATLAWLLVLCAASAACGTGGDVDMGQLTLRADASAAAPETGPCNGQPCATHTGTMLFIEPGASDADADAFATGAAQAPGSDPSAEPELIYPSHETMLPLNLSLLRIAWTPGKSTRFALDFSGPNTTVRVISADTSFTPSDEEWDWLAESNRGGRVEVTLRGLDAEQPSEVWQSNVIELSIAADAVDGAIYYWSTGSRGLMQARIDDPVPVRIYADPAGANAGTCTGCHTVSRDGTRLALSYDKPELGVISLPDRSVILAGGADAMDPKPAPMDPKGMTKAAPPVPASWSTFSPDGKLLLAAAHGKLRLIDADTGASVGDQMEVPLPAGTLATHPDWSPEGDTVALTLATKGGDKQTEGGSIALLPYAGDGTFGTPSVLVASAGGMDNNYFPSFSPDGRYIAFVNASGGSEDADTARIRLVEVASGRVVELPRLNERVGHADGLANLGNSMPTFAPSTGGLYWLAFSSLRAYAELRPADVKKDQLWMAALDPSQQDPSFAAFWAPFQSIDQGNHRPFWVHAPDAPRCGESCSPREICDDGVDNDCDCVIDDCSDELCGNGSDDDGDGRDDKSDPVCAPASP